MEMASQRRPDTTSSSPPILNLPLDLLQLIIHLCIPDDVGALLQTCHKIRAAAGSLAAKHGLLRRRFTRFGYSYDGWTSRWNKDKSPSSTIEIKSLARLVHYIETKEPLAGRYIKWLDLRPSHNPDEETLTDEKTSSVDSYDLLYGGGAKETTEEDTTAGEENPEEGDDDNGLSTVIRRVKQDPDLASLALIAQLPNLATLVAKHSSQFIANSDTERAPLEKLDQVLLLNWDRNDWDTRELRSCMHFLALPRLKRFRAAWLAGSTTSLINVDLAPSLTTIDLYECSVSAKAWEALLTRARGVTTVRTCHGGPPCEPSEWDPGAVVAAMQRAAGDRLGELSLAISRHNSSVLLSSPHDFTGFHVLGKLELDLEILFERGYGSSSSSSSGQDGSDDDFDIPYLVDILPHSIESVDLFCHEWDDLRVENAIMVLKGLGRMTNDDDDNNNNTHHRLLPRLTHIELLAEEYYRESDDEDVVHLISEATGVLTVGTESMAVRPAWMEDFEGLKQYWQSF